MQTLYYTKRFITGMLTGLSVNQIIHFDPKRTAEITRKLRKGSKGRDVVTGDRWVITDASFQNYAR